MAKASDTTSIDRVIDRLSRLPGIGRRSAERVAYHLLKQPTSEVQLLADAITAMMATAKPCSICHHLSECDPCPICADETRDRQRVLVIEEPKDVINLESTGSYRGLYHVLMGRLAPLDGVGPGELTIADLIDRVRRESIAEVILGTSPTMEGDGTALHLAEALKPLGVSVTRLARGLPAGFSIEQASKAALADAITGRQNLVDMQGADEQHH